MSIDDSQSVGIYRNPMAALRRSPPDKRNGSGTRHASTEPRSFALYNNAAICRHRRTVWLGSAFIYASFMVSAIQSIHIARASLSP